MANPLFANEDPQTILNPPVSERTTDSSAFAVSARPQLKPLGSAGTEIFAGYFSEEYLQKLRGRAGQKVFDEMYRSEPQIAMLFNAVTNPIKAGSWEFEAADIPNGEIHKAFIEYQAKECIDWEAHLHECLTMIRSGYSIFEVVHSLVQNHPKFGTFVGLKAIAFRSQKTIERWHLDPDTGNLSSVEQWVQGDLVRERSALVEMMGEFLLVFTLQKEGDNYEGLSALRPMYGPWFRKNLYLKIAAIGAEKNAIGTPMGTVPAGKNKSPEFEEFKAMLENFVAHEDAYMIKPSGWDVEIVKGEFDASAIKELIQLENTEMINSLVANFLALGMTGSGGSYALGTDLSDFFLTGIQNYANIICGVWNRKLIPDLIKLNFGPQESYPKLKASGINDKAGKELAEILKSLVDGKIIKPDDKLETSIRKQYNLSPADPLTAREVTPPKPFVPGGQFSEDKFIKLAEGWKTKWKDNKASVKEVMQEGLCEIVDGYEKQITSLWNKATPAGRVNIASKLEPKGVAQYREQLREALAEIANQSLIDAKKETPKARDVKLSESIQLAAPAGGYFDALPPKIRRIVAAQAALIADTQAADINKIVSFQFSSSAQSTDDVDQVLLDIDEAVQPTIEGATGMGMSVDAAAGNAVSQIANQARLSWFFEPEVLDTIESFTFYNEDPISEVCQELDGTTWAVNDPDLDRYSPPLHHNCKSRLVPNEKGADGNPDVQRGGTPITQKALDSITLCECDYHLEFKLVESKGKTKKSLIEKAKEKLGL